MSLLKKFGNFWDAHHTWVCIYIRHNERKSYKQDMNSCVHDDNTENSSIRTLFMVHEQQTLLFWQSSFIFANISLMINVGKPMFGSNNLCDRLSIPCTWVSYSFLADKKCLIYTG